MDIAEVQDRESLERYLEALPEYERSAISQRFAFRAAARVLPNAAQYLVVDSSQGNESPKILHIFGAVAFSGVANLVSSPLSPQAAYALASRADASAEEKGIPDFTSGFAAGSAAFAAGSAVDSAVEFSEFDSASLAVAYAAYAVQVDYTNVEIWPLLEADLSGGRETPLWPRSMPNQLSQAWEHTKYLLRRDSTADWPFWISWYERVLAGRDILPDAIGPILNTLTEKDWQKGPAHINPMFDAVLAMYRADDANREPPNRPRVTASEVKATKAAMIAHRAELPATFDAVQGLIALEVERLQKRNYTSDDDKDESLRQIDVLVALSDAVGRMRPLIPNTADMPDQDAEQAASLAQLYLFKFKEWPRANADEIVDNTYRLGLIGITATVLPMIGIAPSIAALAGAALFGGKKLADGAKAAKDIFGSKQ